MIVQKERIVTEWWHRYPNLRQIIQVLQDWDLSEQETVGNVLRHHVSAHEMLDRASLATMRSKNEGVETLRPVKYIAC